MTKLGHGRAQRAEVVSRRAPQAPAPRIGPDQTRMAEDLGVSPSYLNHLERNQRPLTAQILLRLARTYDIDIRALSSDHDAAGAQDLSEVLADQFFRDLGIPRHEIAEVPEELIGEDLREILR